MTHKFRSNDRKILIISITQRKNNRSPANPDSETIQAKAKDKLENRYETPITDKWLDYLLHNKL